MSGMAQALLMAGPTLPGTTLWYVTPQSGEVGGASAANPGTLGGTLTRAGPTNGSVETDGVYTTGPAAISWISSGSSVPAASFTSGVGEIFEGWFYFASVSAGSESVDLQIAHASSAERFNLKIAPGGGSTNTLSARVNGTLLYSAASAAYRNTWLHAAISKDPSNLCTMFVNGVAVATLSRTKIEGSHELQLIKNGSGTEHMRVANVRYRVGHYYTADFTPPARTY